MVVAPQGKERQRPAPRLDAAFLAQLLTGRETLTGQRHAATRAYAATRASTIRRLPPGYRRTLDA